MGSRAHKTVVVADDDPRLRELVCLTLCSHYAVIEAADGREALRAAQQYGPDLLLLDLAMPGCDGLSVCRELKADPLTHAMIVVVLTALADHEHEQLAAAAGADSFLKKPFSPVALISTIRSYLG